MNVSAINPTIGNAPSLSAETGATVIVQSGDTLWRIAAQHGITLKELVLANPQIANPDLIYPGQVVRLPMSDATAVPESAALAGDTPQVGPDGRFTRVQLAQLFHQAGFRGDNLVAIVAIAMRESGGKPTAFNGNAGTRDLSYGLTQINMLGTLGPARRAQLGLVSNEQLLDPAVNARAAFVLSSNGTNLSPWGGYKGVSNTYNTDIGAARTAVAQAQAQGQSGEVLQRGATGSQVRELQSMLQSLGYYDANIGGTFGRLTHAAVLAFQRDHSLIVDGRADAQTLTALRQAAASGPNQTPQGGDGGPRATTQATTSAPGIAPVTSGPAYARVRAALDYAIYWATRERTAYVGGASPYRFGGVGNDGKAQLSGQATYLSPRGIVGFDCSGLVVAMYRQAGIDLQAQGLFNTRNMASGLPPVSKDQLQPGDLLVKAGSHVVIYLGDVTGDGRPDIVEAAPYGHNPRDGSAPVGGVRIADAASFLNDGAYVGRRVSL